MTAVYFFAGILAVLLVAVLVAPLLDTQPTGAAASDPDERLEAALEALRDLEFEYQTGKIDEDDYRALRSEHAAAAIAARDAGAAVRSDPDAGTGVGGPAACTVCGGRIATGAKFCPRCGTAVAPEAASAKGSA